MRRRAFFVLPRSSPPRIAAAHCCPASPPRIASAHCHLAFHRNISKVTNFGSYSCLSCHLDAMPARRGSAKTRGAPPSPHPHLGPFQHSAHRMLIAPLNLRVRGRPLNRAACTCAQRARRCPRACSSSSAPGSRPSRRHSPPGHQDLTRGKPWAS